MEAVKRSMFVKKLGWGGMNRQSTKILEKEKILYMILNDQHMS
jgi:hypothetical protein